MNVNQNYCGDLFAISTNIKSLFYTPKTCNVCKFIPQEKGNFIIDNTKIFSIFIVKRKIQEIVSSM